MELKTHATKMQNHYLPILVLLINSTDPIATIFLFLVISEGYMEVSLKFRIKFPGLVLVDVGNVGWGEVCNEENDACPFSYTV